MSRLGGKFEPAFARDLKKLAKKHVSDAPLEEVISLVMENTPAARDELIRRHGMHTLSGAWAGSQECHVCNAGGLASGMAQI